MAQERVKIGKVEWSMGGRVDLRELLCKLYGQLR